MNLLIVIPAFNSGHTLPTLIKQIQVFKHDILLIDDGSTDNTETICQFSSIKVIKHQSNQGLSSAMQSAFTYAEKESFTHILALDSDLQHDPHFIPDFIRSAKDSDLVIANRFAKLESIPSCKIASNLFASCLVEEMFDKFIPDISCGYRMYKVSSFVQHDFGANYEFIFSALFRALTNDYKINFCNVSAIYNSDILLSTRRTELLSILNATIKIKQNDIIAELLTRVENSLDFFISLSGIGFYGYYLQRNESYIIQCDLVAAIQKHRANENSSLSSSI
ncbi:MAG: glycosyltransferase family 2 protein [Proteobacteria bacterium]|nr:glycosyltransferase family 2 protein [Pseudomonadota bacterium]